MSDIKNLQKIVDDLNYAVEKLQEFGAIDEIPEVLGEIKAQAKNLKKQKLFSGLLVIGFTLILSACMGYFSAYKYTSNNLAKMDLGLLVVADGNKKQIYIPKTWDGKELKDSYLFTKK